MISLDPDSEWPAVRRAFEALLDLPEDERSSALSTLPLAETTKQKIAELLTHHRDGDFLQADPPLTSLPPFIGTYRLEAELGRGGMGSVFRAIQPSTGRSIALKVMHTNLGSPEGRVRFEREISILARLEHPCIARIYEAGIASFVGREAPYFAMELIDGLPLDTYAETASLNLRQRVELLARVSSAVGFAHSHGIVHRDLKPANILISADGVPHILDFGVAHTVEHELALQPEPTASGVLLGTFLYMSPEQMRGSPLARLASTDVYAIGALGYQLLAGKLPHERKGLSIVAAIQRSSIESIVPLSQHNHAVPRDLEAVIHSALNEESARRYPNANELAADLERYLIGAPVVARPPSLREQVARYCRRHRFLLSMVCLVAGASLAIAAIALYSARATKRAAAVAHVQAQHAVSIKELLRQILERADPLTLAPSGPDITVWQVVQGAASDLDARPPPDAEVEIELRLILGQTLKGVGRYKEALTLLDRAVERAKILGKPAEDSAWALQAERGNLLSNLGEHASALAAFREAILLQSRSATTAKKARVHNDYSLALRKAGNHAQAREECQFAYDLVQAEPLDTGVRAATALNFAGIFANNGEYANARSYYEEALSFYEQTYAPDHPVLAITRNNLGCLELRMGEILAADAAFKVVSENLRKYINKPSRTLADVINNYASTREQLGDYETSEQLYREALAMYEPIFGEFSPTAEETSQNLALLLESAGQFEDAAERFARYYELRRSRLEMDDEPGLFALVHHAYCLDQLGLAEDAEFVLRDISERSQACLLPGMRARVACELMLYAREHGQPAHFAFGIVSEPLINSSRGAGALITEVLPAGIAAALKCRRGDLLVQLHGAQVSTAASIEEALARWNGKGPLEVVLCDVHREQRSLTWNPPTD